MVRRPLGSEPYDSALFFDGSWWVTAFDVIAAAIISGRVPEVRRVVELVPAGRKERRSVCLAGGEPSSGDLFVALLRRQAALDEEGAELAAAGFKPLRNSAAVGLPAQVTRIGEKPVRQQIWGPDGSRVARVPQEVPGAHCCLPVAAQVTAFARFQLARIEAKVNARGGVVAAMDTDGHCTVATPEGGLVPCPGGDLSMPDGRAAVRALSFDEVREIHEEEGWADPLGEGTPWRAKFGSFEQQAYMLAICNKRLALYRRGADGEVVLLDASGHLLAGRYLSPTGSEEVGPSGAPLWVEDVWRHVMDPERYSRPDWSDMPAIRKVAIRRPVAAKRFGEALGLRPFNFLLQAEPAPGREGHGPVAPFSRSRRDWRRFHDPRTREFVETCTEADVAAGRAEGGRVIATLGGVIDRWWATTDDRYEAAVLNTLLPAGVEPLGIGEQHLPDGIERVVLAAAVGERLLLHPPADLVDTAVGRGDDWKGSATCTARSRCGCQAGEFRR
jgi:hypothetical protein